MSAQNELIRKGWRVRARGVALYGSIYYVVQQRKWWGWKTWHSELPRSQAIDIMNRLAEDLAKTSPTEGGR